jgi:hypothetical protein
MKGDIKNMISEMGLCSVGVDIPQKETLKIDTIEFLKEHMDNELIGLLCACHITITYYDFADSITPLN